MNKFLVVVFVILLIASLGFYSCTKSSSGEDTSSGNDTITSISDPKVLGEEIGQNYDEMMNKLVTILEEADDIEKLKQDVAVLKEEYITIFVQYGELREKLSEEDKPRVDSALRSFNYSLDMTRFEKYSELQQHFWKIDSDLGSEISSFNILTQYAIFELLKKQEPEEAERLGIE